MVRDEDACDVVTCPGERSELMQGAFIVDG